MFMYCHARVLGARRRISAKTSWEYLSERAVIRRKSALIKAYNRHNKTSRYVEDFTPHAVRRIYIIALLSAWAGGILVYSSAPCNGLISKTFLVINSTAVILPKTISIGKASTPPTC